MVAKDWYITSARCVQKGVSRTKSKTSWMSYGGCQEESDDDYDVNVTTDDFSIGLFFHINYFFQDISFSSD